MSGAILLSCLVLAVGDGDGLKARCPEHDGVLTVRLYVADAPEVAHPDIGIKEQPWGRQARDALAALCLGQLATIEIMKPDPHPRRVDANVTCKGVEAGREMVRTGNAWAFYRHSAEKLLEQQARAQGLGLWSLPDPVRPSEWRHRK